MTDEQRERLTNAMMGNAQRVVYDKDRLVSPEDRLKQQSIECNAIEFDGHRFDALADAYVAEFAKMTDDEIALSIIDTSETFWTTQGIAARARALFEQVVRRTK